MFLMPRGVSVLSSFSILLVVLHSAIGCHSKNLSDKDEQLVTKIREAISQQTKIEDVETFVGVKATVNTSRTRGRDGLPDFLDDPQEVDQIPNLREAKDFVYWVRPIESKPTRIVGILWNDKNEMKLFFGIVRKKL